MITCGRNERASAVDSDDACILFCCCFAIRTYTILLYPEHFARAYLHPYQVHPHINRSTVEGGTSEDVKVEGTAELMHGGT